MVDHPVTMGKNDDVSRLTTLANCVEDLTEDLIAYKLPDMPELSELDCREPSFETKIRGAIDVCERHLRLLHVHTVNIDEIAVSDEEREMPIAQEILSFQFHIGRWVSALQNSLTKLHALEVWGEAVVLVFNAHARLRAELHKDQRRGSSSTAEGLSLSSDVHAEFEQQSVALGQLVESCEEARDQFADSLDGDPDANEAQSATSTAPAPKDGWADFDGDGIDEFKAQVDWRIPFRAVLKGTIGSLSRRTCRAGRDLRTAVEVHQNTRRAAIEAVNTVAVKTRACLMGCFGDVAISPRHTATTTPDEEAKTDNLKSYTESVAQLRNSIAAAKKLKFLAVDNHPFLSAALAAPEYAEVWAIATANLCAGVRNSYVRTRSDDGTLNDFESQLADLDGALPTPACTSHEEPTPDNDTPDRVVDESYLAESGDGSVADGESESGIDESGDSISQHDLSSGNTNSNQPHPPQTRAGFGQDDEGGGDPAVSTTSAISRHSADVDVDTGEPSPNKSDIPHGSMEEPAHGHDNDQVQPSHKDDDSSEFDNFETDAEAVSRQSSTQDVKTKLPQTSSKEILPSDGEQQPSRGSPVTLASAISPQAQAGSERRESDQMLDDSLDFSYRNQMSLLNQGAHGMRGVQLWQCCML